MWFWVLLHWIPCFLNHNQEIIRYYEDGNKPPSTAPFRIPQILFLVLDLQDSASKFEVKAPGWPSMLSILYLSLITPHGHHRSCPCQTDREASWPSVDQYNMLQHNLSGQPSSPYFGSSWALAAQTVVSPYTQEDKNWQNDCWWYELILYWDVLYIFLSWITSVSWHSSQFYSLVFF